MLVALVGEHLLDVLTMRDRQLLWPTVIFTVNILRANALAAERDCLKLVSCSNEPLQNPAVVACDKAPLDCTWRVPVSFIVQTFCSNNYLLLFVDPHTMGPL